MNSTDRVDVERCKENITEGEGPVFLRLFLLFSFLTKKGHLRVTFYSVWTLTSCFLLVDFSDTYPPASSFPLKTQVCENKRKVAKTL